MGRHKDLTRQALVRNTCSTQKGQDITGNVTFNTPYGWIFIPLNLTEVLR